jgi:FAD/FMN-containing dehydrogenase
MLGPNGERWINVHGIVPFSAAARTLAACDAVVKRHARAIEAHGITTGWLMCGVGVAGILIEPVIFWPDTRHAFHERVLPPEYLSGLESFPENPSGRQAVAGLRKDLAEVLLDAGAINLQIGRFYDYQRGLDPTAGAFLRQIKDLVDPHQRMNPGSLGLNHVAGP